MDPLATIAEFSDRIPGGVEQGDTARAQATLVDASALIRAEIGATVAAAWETDGDPDIAKTICMSAARRAFLNPDGVTNLAIDGHSAGFATASPDVYLTAAEKKALRRVGGRSGLWTQSTTRSIDDVGDVPAVALGADPVGAIEESDPFGASWGNA